MIDKSFEREITRLIPANLPYEFCEGKKHVLLRINGKLAATISGRSKVEGGRGMQNVLSAVKRFVRQCTASD